MTARQKTIYTCDICGKEFENEYITNKIGLDSGGVSGLVLGGETFSHICENCFKSFEALLDNCKENKNNDS